MHFESPRRESKKLESFRGEETAKDTEPSSKHQGVNKMFTMTYYDSTIVTYCNTIVRLIILYWVL